MNHTFSVASLQHVTQTAQLCKIWIRQMHNTTKTTIKGIGNNIWCIAHIAKAIGAVCYSVILSVSRITTKVIDRFH